MIKFRRCCVLKLDISDRQSIKQHNRWWNVMEFFKPHNFGGKGVALYRCPPPVVRMCTSHNRGGIGWDPATLKTIYFAIYIINDMLWNDARLGENHAVYIVWEQQADLRGKIEPKHNLPKINNFQLLIPKKSKHPEGNAQPQWCGNCTIFWVWISIDGIEQQLKHWTKTKTLKNLWHSKI